MDSREAVTLLRSQVQVLQAATIPDRNIIVVSDGAEKVDRSESLLRQQDAIVRVADPHQPLDLKQLQESPPATRVLKVESADTNTVVTLLRAIYQVRDVSESAEERTVTARAAQPVLDSSEALLRELGLLAEPAP
jgi:uncharacterized protein YjcR